MSTPDFQNTRSAFRSRSTSELKKMRLLFQLMGYSGLTKLGIFLTKTALKWHFPVKKLIKGTLFKQFCGGENLADCKAVMQKLHSFGIQSIPDYSAEADSSPDYNATSAEIIKSIRFVSEHPSCAFAVFKASALGPSLLFEKWKTGTLTEGEQVQLQEIYERIKQVCNEAYELNVKLLIDAEESWIQDWIDTAVMQLSIRFNRKTPVLFLTFQLYRNDGTLRLKGYLEHARMYKYSPAVKIVRGAYLEKERARASEMNYPSPIHSTKAATDEAYNEALIFCIENGIAMCAGSHNEESTLLLTKLFPDKKAEVYFAQLYGMSDNLSFVLAENNFPVAKYLPYGPVELVMPYLFRRAEENKSVTGEAGRELRLVEREIQRRLQANKKCKKEEGRRKLNI